VSFFKSVGSFLKKTVGGALGGFITGGPAGAVLGGAAGAFGGGSSSSMVNYGGGLVAMPGTGGSTGNRLPAPTGFNWSPQGPMNQLGFTGTTAVSTSPGTGYSYRRMYTKKGTPRRIKRNGQPYAIPRLNPMNPRAARRAVVRIRGARKLLQRIERSLPRATQRRRPAAH
jgi:hypothetical protein